MPIIIPCVWDDQAKPRLKEGVRGALADHIGIANGSDIVDSEAAQGPGMGLEINDSNNVETREAIAELIRRVLEVRCDEAAVRRMMETPDGFDRGLWQELASLGIAGMIIDEAEGGSGLGLVHLERVAEAFGAVLAGGPFLASSVLAVTLLKAVGRTAPLPAIANGSLIATVAVTGLDGTWTADGVGVQVQDGRLYGTAAFVLDGQIADLLIVVARADNDILIVETAAAAPGVEIKPVATFDQTRRLAQIRFDGVRGEVIGRDWAAVAHALDVARIALAGEQAGGARALLDRTVEYIRTRFQFGRAIGSFQAIKHMAADLLLESESAISAARHAAESSARGDADAPIARALASFACADAFVRVAADAIQMHGGIGFTWEHPAHLYLRRARGGAQLFGTSDAHRERFVQLLEDC